MAKTATAKKTAKAPAKKTAKKAAKAAPAKKTASGVGRPAHKYKEGARIKVLVDENPCRAGSGKHERVARILKFDGKLVDDFVKAGGKTGSLRFSEEQKWIKII